MRVILKNFRLVDEDTDIHGTVIIENALISEVLPGEPPARGEDNAAMCIDGRFLSPSGGTPVLTPAFVDLHAHFRDLPPSDDAAPLADTAPSELIESAALAAAAGGFGTVVCMANTKPAIDTLEKFTRVKKRSDTLGLIDLYPVMSLTKGMEGKELSEIGSLSLQRAPASAGSDSAIALEIPLMLSEDGKDIASDALFLAAMKEAKRLGLPVSCHCDFGGSEALAAKEEGKSRSVWSRIEENNATQRAIELGKQAGCHIHIAHVSTKEAVEAIARAKAEHAAGVSSGTKGFSLSCEVMPHNLCLSEEDARRMGDESFGRVNPPLRAEEDRAALVEALVNGTIDAIATDHAPHTMSAKAGGAPGFSGLETAFAAVFTRLCRESPSFRGAFSAALDLKRLSSLMSANPARLLGFGGATLPGGAAHSDGEPLPDRAHTGAVPREGNGSGPAGGTHSGDESGSNPAGGTRAREPRGRLLPGYRADLTIVDILRPWIVDTALFRSRGKNSPFSGRELYGKILMTLHSGRVVFSQL